MFDKDNASVTSDPKITANNTDARLIHDDFPRG